MTDGRVPIVSGLLAELPIPDWYWVDLDAVAGSLVAACDEWDSRPCPEVEAIVGPLTRQLSAREEALDRLLSSFDFTRQSGNVPMWPAAWAVADAHRAVKGDL